MRLTLEEANAAIRTIAKSGNLISERGTCGVMAGPASEGFGADIAVWFITDSKKEGTIFPITRTQALQLREQLQTAVDINKGLTPRSEP